MLNTDKKLKLYYSIGEVAQMLGVSETLLRFWEKKFPQLNPKRAGRDIRQYRQEDVETAKMIYHLVKSAQQWRKCQTQLRSCRPLEGHPRRTGQYAQRARCLYLQRSRGVKGEY